MIRENDLQKKTVGIKSILNKKLFLYSDMKPGNRVQINIHCIQTNITPDICTQTQS